MCARIQSYIQLYIFPPSQGLIETFVSFEISATEFHQQNHTDIDVEYGIRNFCIYLRAIDLKFQLLNGV